VFSFYALSYSDASQRDVKKLKGCLGEVVSFSKTMTLSFEGHQEQVQGKLKALDKSRKLQEQLDTLGSAMRESSGSGEQRVRALQTQLDELHSRAADEGEGAAKGAEGLQVCICTYNNRHNYTPYTAYIH
jgi:hypothetical protein